MNSSFRKNIEQINSFFGSKNIADEKDALDISKILNREAAGEYTSYRKENFANADFLEKLIDLSRKYNNNNTILRNIISALGFICTKYRFYSDDVFQYLLENTNNDSNIVRIAIIKNIYKFPQFINWENCCEYILTIPRVAPKKESIEYFYRIVDKYSKDFSPQNINRILDLLTKSIDGNSINEHRKKDFLDLIARLKH